MKILIVMKGTWITTIAAGCIILALTAFLAVQYSWLKQASDAEQEKMQRRLDADARSFAADLDREAQLAYFNFQTESSIWERSDWAAFERRYAEWREKAQYPELIKQIIFVKKGDEKALVYVPSTGTFQPAAETGIDIAELRRKIESSSQPRQFYDEPPAFVLNVPVMRTVAGQIVVRQAVKFTSPSDLAPTPTSYGELIILLDPDIITGRILPDLMAKHFPDGDYRAEVRNMSGVPIFSTDGELASADATAGLISLIPNNLIFIGDTIAAVRKDANAVSNVRGNARIETHSFTRTQINTDGNSNKANDIQLAPDATATATTSDGKQFRTSIVTTSSNAAKEPWTFSLQHTSGSIGAFIQNELYRKLLIGGLLYFLSIAAIIAIVYSAARSRRFAQRQIDFVSSVSHEFRTPLAVIYSAGENLADGIAADRGQVATYGQLIKNEGRRLTGMVEQILEFAGARSGKRKYNFVETNINDAVREALDDCMPVLSEQGFEIKADLDGGVPMVQADSDAVSGAVRNLITNAAKYSNGTKWLRLSVLPSENAVRIVVEDHGIGIEKGDEKRIFEPFYRSRNVVDAQIRGNGLGLSYVKDVVEAHGGSVRVERNNGKGSTFTIELPVN